MGNAKGKTMTDEELFAKLKELADKKIYLLDYHYSAHPEIRNSYEHVETLFYDPADEDGVVCEESVFRNTETDTVFTIYQEVSWDFSEDVYKTEIHLVREIPVIKMRYENTEQIF